MRRTLVRFAATALAVAGMSDVAAAQQPSAGAFSSAWAPVQEFFHQTLRDEGIIGGSLVFFHGDTVLAKEFHGFADVASGRKVDERTIYHWASITKTFTAIALMQLRDRQLLTLDDPVTQRLPELRAVHNPFGPMDAITFRQLLSHSAGFRNGTWPFASGAAWEPHEPASWSQLVAMFPYTEVLYPPGSKYSYSNPGFIYLGRTIELLTGEDYETYVEKNVLRPLDMRASYFDRTPYHLLADRSNNYDVVDGKPIANGLDFDTGITVSNGGLNAPVSDMVKYLQFLADAPGVSAAGRGVLARRTLQEMWKPVISLGTTEPDAMGLGFFRISRNGIPLVGHTGSQKAFRSFFYIDPVSKAGVIAVFNTAPADDPRNPAEIGPAKPRIGVLIDGLVQRVAADVLPMYRR